MEETNLTESQKLILDQINRIIYDTSLLKQKIESNKNKINEEFDKFSLFYDSYGAEVYGNPEESNSSISDSNTVTNYDDIEYGNLIKLINEDIDDIDEMIQKHKLIKELMQDVPLDNRLLAATAISLQDIDELTKERDDRIVLISKMNFNLSKNFHDVMLTNIIEAPINLYHDITPFGQIMNKFTICIIIFTYNIFLWL